MSASLVPTIERTGGRVLINADVRQILTRKSKHENGYETYGVELTTGDRILARYGVVSSCGYLNTFRRLISADVVSSLNIPTSFPTLSNSLGFVMLNIGLSGATAVQMGIDNYNVWHLPTDTETGDMFSKLHEFWEEPLKSHKSLPIMVTFPSLKEHAHTASQSHITEHTCQILIASEYAWFAAWAAKGKSGAKNSRGEDYEQMKKQWQDLTLMKLFELFPGVKPYVSFVDVSTPLSIEHYLRNPEGGACGLDLTPERFTNIKIQESLDVVTKIDHLYLTGQDTLICGQPLVQLAGVITAFRMTSLLQTLRVMLQTIFCTIPQ